MPPFASNQDESYNDGAIGSFDEIPIVSAVKVHEADNINVEITLPNFASNQEEELNNDGALESLVEIPLISTRKHIGEEIRTEEESPSESEDDLDNITVSTSLSSFSPICALRPPLLLTFLEFDPCSAVTRSFASCSQYPIQGSNDFHFRTCCGCGRFCDNIEDFTREITISETGRTDIPNHTPSTAVDEEGEPVGIDVMIDGGAQIYCYECARINQGRIEHARDIKLVMNELVSQFKENKRILAANTEESKHLEGLISGCEDRERNRKRKNLGFGSLKREIKSAISSFRSKFNRHSRDHRDHRAPELESEGSVSTEEVSVEMRDIQTIYSSPTSIHYWFDHGTNEDSKTKKFSSIIKHARDTHSKKNRKTSSIDRHTEVRAVAVLWS